MDPFSENIVIDHNRCILCGRCVRACHEVTGIHAIDFAKRGYRTMVSADLEQPLGESSCTSCGACVQACPTGAIFSKLSLYKGKTGECRSVATTCPLCGAGCQISALVKDNNLIKINAPSLGNPAGALCGKGRFGLLFDPRPRVTAALVRNGGGELEERPLDVALELIADRLTNADGNLAAVASTRYPVETLALFKRLIREAIGSEYIDTIDGSMFRLISKGVTQFGSSSGLDIECPPQAR